MKKLAMLIVMLFISIAALSGCAAVTVNDIKFYTAIVAKVGDDTITRYELVSAYNSYGYKQYVTNGGKTPKEAIRSTLDFLMDRKMLIAYAKDNSLTLTKSEFNDICIETFDYFDNQYTSFENTAREKLGIDEPEASETAEDKASEYIYTQYTKRAEIVMLDATTGLESASGTVEGIKMIAIEENFDEADAILDDFNSHFAHCDDYDYMATALKNAYAREDVEANVLEKAKELFYDALVSNQKYQLDDNGKKLSTDEADVFEHEFKRVYQNAYENALLEKIREEYLKTYKLDASQLVKKYSALVKADYAQYSTDLESYYSKMTSDSSTVYYHPDEEFFYVYNVLLSYTDAQKTAIKEIKAFYESGTMTKAKYDERMASIAASIAVKARNAEGEEVGEAISANEIYNEIVNAVDAQTFDYSKLQAFNTYLYKYNSDPGMLNKDTPYVVGLTHSAMVESFNEASRELNDAGEYGAISELTLSDYGYHIIFYAGKVENTFGISDLDNLTLTALNNKYVSRLRDYTYFDKMFDTVFPTGSYEGFSSRAETGYASYETSLIASLSQDISAKIYQSVLKSTLQ